MKPLPLLLALAFASISLSGQAADTTSPTLLLSQPSISAERIAFVYGGDIWVTDREGQHPVRLVSQPASAPRFSPDGKTLAFTASYNNTASVYTVPTAGGSPKRLTWHPSAAIVNGWSADGRRVLFSSHSEVLNARSNQLYEIPAEGGFEKKVMDAVAFEGTWSPDGKRLAYRPYIQAYLGVSGWRQHRGGSTPPIWIIDPAGKTLEKIPHVNATDSNPIWAGKDVVFISDRADGAANLFAYDTQTKQLRQLTHETAWDVRSASAWDGKVVYEVGGALKELDLATGHTRVIPIDLRQQASAARPQWKDASQNITTAQLSPSGKRVIVSARGEIFTVPVKDGSTRNVTQTAGVREKDGLWSADGKQIAYITDTGNHHMLALRDQAGLQKPRLLDLGNQGYYSLLAWSPDNTRIVYRDNHLHLYAIDLAKGSITLINTDLRRDDTASVAFSQDGRWLAYTTPMDNYLACVKVYDFQTGKSTQVSDGLVDARSPAFSGTDYLYFLASIDAGTTAVGFDLSTHEKPIRYGIFAALLSAEGKSPVQAKSGDEEVAKAGADKDGKDKGSSKESDKTAEGSAHKEAVKPVHIDLTGIDQRIVALPVAQRRYDALAVAADGALYYLDRPQNGASVEPEQADGNDHDIEGELIRFSLEDLKAKPIKQDVVDFSLSHDGKKLLLRAKGGKLEVADAGEKIEAKPVDLSGLRTLIDPRQEWQQIFDEAWWMEKEFFYAPNMHGLDWAAIKAKYQPLLQHVRRREDLNRLIVDMIAELQVGHNRAYGGDTFKEAPANVGLLGADFEIHEGRYRLKTIYQGDRWNPAVKAPLATPGQAAKVGEYLLAVNGQPLDASVNLYALLGNTVGKQITLTLGADAAGKIKRDITVTPVASETELRAWHWVEHNQQYVDRKSGGKIAYVYMPDTADNGLTYFNRMFYAQIGKQGVIVDDRKNNGGHGANYVIETLSRPYLASWTDRDGKLMHTPGGAIYGPKAMLIDQDAGSGGDFMPYAFRHAGLGPLIGTRTWGGLIGIQANPPFVDGGGLSVPFFRVISPEGKWMVENEGVAPDIEVPLDPLAVNAGSDPQLDAAIDSVMTRLQSWKPIEQQTHPAYPTQLGQ